MYIGEPPEGSRVDGLRTPTVHPRHPCERGLAPYSRQQGAHEFPCRSVRAEDLNPTQCVGPAQRLRGPQIGSKLPTLAAPLSVAALQSVLHKASAGRPPPLKSLVGHRTHSFMRASSARSPSRTARTKRLPPSPHMAVSTLLGHICCGTTVTCINVNF